MAIMNQLPNNSAFPNANSTGMTMRQWYKSQILAGIHLPDIPYAPSNYDMKFYVKIICQLADLLVEEDRVNGS